MACGATLKRSIEFDPLHSPSQRSPKRRRCMPMTLSPSTPPTRQNQTKPSPFGDVSPKLTSEQIAANISAEIRRMHRRKQLFNTCDSPTHSGSACSMGALDQAPHHINTDAGMCSPVASQSSTFFNALSANKKDTPLFTFRQVSLVCERMLKEREDQIREEYNKVLNCKLAEQYEAFLKFNHDQIQKRFCEAPASYVS